MTEVPRTIVEGLQSLVEPRGSSGVPRCNPRYVLVQKALRRYTMQKFITHECVATGIFNANFECTSSSAHMSLWNDRLKNSEVVLKLMLARMEQDHLALPPKMKKPWSGRDAAPLPVFFARVTARACGPFRFFVFCSPRNSCCDAVPCSVISWINSGPNSRKASPRRSSPTSGNRFLM